MSLPRRLSPSSIDRWRSCPRRFFYQDVERVSFDESYSYGQLVGLVVHKALESLLRLEPGARQEQRESRVDSSVRRFTAVQEFNDAAETMLREEAQALVANYLVSERSQSRPLKLEQTFQLRLKNGTVIQTRVDRVDRTASGQLEIVDYKTGREQLDERDLACETAPIVQLLAVGRASEVPVEKVTWSYLRSSESISWWPEAEDVEAASDRLVGLLRKIHLDREFAPNPGVHCSNCPFVAICPASNSAGVAEVSAVAQAASR